MKVLIGCEESQVVCKAFRLYGYEAYSCDILSTRGNPDWHIKGDIMQIIPTSAWNLIILHPDCTCMACSGNRWYGVNMPRNNERVLAVHWTLNLWELAKKYSPKVALENPKSVIFPFLRKQGTNIQYIHPWQFGHGEQKETGLALHNLQPLKSTNIVDGREQRIWKMAPSPTRKRDRSETFLGIALAMAQQWGT
jgi:hypothetical protein